jgi:GTP diphosphokinase / guanosine-3',5'-bis(diphosphate) 3'-diphosphatase
MAGQVLTASAERHSEQFDRLLAEVASYNPDVDRVMLERAYRFASEAHENQQRRSGEDFILHPLGVALILAELRSDDATIEQVRDEFGDEVARLVEGVTKLTRIHFQSREQAQAENYRKMIVAMADDHRVILIKLADRLHNMRTIEYLGKQKQLQKARETLEVYAPLAHRLGIHTIKWELEDLAFQTLFPSEYANIRARVNERRAEREKLVERAGKELKRELDKVDIPAEISSRAKHFYSIYEKMAKRGKEFNEIHDLTAMRVIVDREGKEGERDCYGALGVIHSLWKPLPVPGRFKDYIARPKFNMYRSLHTTVTGPDGRPLEIQVRTREMHRTAEQGIAAHWLYKGGSKGKSKKATEAELAWMKQLAEWQREESDSRELMRAFPELALDEVYVFTPKGEVKSLPDGSTPIDFAYSVHTDVGHRTVGAKVNGRIVPLHYRLRSGDVVEILTSKQASRGPSRDWLSLAVSSRARNKIRQWFSRETREVAEQRGRESLDNALKQHNLPYRKLSGSPLLAEIIREMGFKKAEDFYLALGSGKLQVSQVANKVLHRLKTDEVVEEEALPRKPKAREAVESQNFGINVPGVEHVLVRMAKCCTPVPGDEIVGYISLGKGITIHRLDCQNVKALMRNPDRFTPVEWDGSTSQGFRVQIAVVSWDRPRLLEDVARTFAEHGTNIVEYGGHVEDQMAKNWYVAELGDIKALRALLGSLRNLESVFDAYRVTPS